MAEDADFAGAYQQAVDAILCAVSAVGEARDEHLKDASVAVSKALHDARSSEEWYLADHLRQSIRDVVVA